MEPVQIVLLLVIVILTILLGVLGIQVFLILREIRKTVEKTNKVLDDAGVIIKSVADPISTLSSLAISIKTGVTFANWFKKIYTLLLQHNPFNETKDPSVERSHEDMLSREKAKAKSDLVKEAPFSSAMLDFQSHVNGETKTSAETSEERRPTVRRFFRGIGRKIKKPGFVT